MAKMPPTAAELRSGFVIRREISRPAHIKRDDWESLPRTQKTTVVAKGRCRKLARAGTEAQIADGIDGVRRYDFTCRWVSGMQSTDSLQIDGERYAIEGPPTNWEQKNKWLVLTAVYNESKQDA